MIGKRVLILKHKKNNITNFVLSESDLYLISKCKKSLNKKFKMSYLVMIKI